MTTSLVLKPKLSEKAYALSASRVYVFEIPNGSNSQQVAEAVSKQFSVGVVSVRIAAIPSKSRQIYRKRGQSISASGSASRKAYVTLKEGDSLPFFASEEKAAKKAAKESK